MTDFVLQITDWYRLNARNLPWRETKNAYFIWLSEVIMQQTRVNQGTAYYNSFVSTYPTVIDLANASEESVLKLWQGLGYYSRARNLHKTSKEVVARFSGEFPANYNELLSLSGIGSYSAAAIGSFAFDLPHAVVDGNVYRVLSRYFGIDTPIDSTQGKKEFQQLADELIPHNNPAIYNQAIMEFGALQCTPKSPSCMLCPLCETCLSAHSTAINERPVKSKKTAVRNRYFHYLHIEADNSVALVHRTGKDVWQHLYEFPMVETTSEELLDSDLIPFELKKNQLTVQYKEKHILSHQRIYAVFYSVPNLLKQQLQQFEFHQLEKAQTLPIHRLMERYVEKEGFGRFITSK